MLDLAESVRDIRFVEDKQISFFPSYVCVCVSASVPTANESVDAFGFRERKRERKREKLRRKERKRET